ncbi:MAG: hypothetical protein IPL43_04310 [Micropruina sp.]|nr:hypothetical protein [Micropruina sp.]
MGCRWRRGVGIGRGHAEVGEQVLTVFEVIEAAVGVLDLRVPWIQASRIISLASSPSSQAWTVAPTM